MNKNEVYSQYLKNIQAYIVIFIRTEEIRKVIAAFEYNNNESLTPIFQSSIIENRILLFNEIIDLNNQNILEKLDKIGGELVSKTYTIKDKERDDNRKREQEEALNLEKKAREAERKAQEAERKAAKDKIIEEERIKSRNDKIDGFITIYKIIIWVLGILWAMYTQTNDFIKVPMFFLGVIVCIFIGSSIGNYLKKTDW